jgi:hypothetical protein
MAELQGWVDYWLSLWTQSAKTAVKILRGGERLAVSLAENLRQMLIRFLERS